MCKKLDVYYYCDIIDGGKCRDTITDKIIQYLGMCEKLNLSYCPNITDEGVKHLGKCKVLIRNRSIWKDAKD